jgi:hypothetical protein
MEMLKFEIEILNEYSYGQLLMTKNQLDAVKKILKNGKEESTTIMSRVEFEKQISRINENLDTIGIAMTSKESECFDLNGKYELICLN